jgi:hypothetical protein
MGERGAEMADRVAPEAAGAAAPDPAPRPGQRPAREPALAKSAPAQPSGGGPFGIRLSEVLMLGLFLLLPGRKKAQAR